MFFHKKSSISFITVFIAMAWHSLFIYSTLRLQSSQKKVKTIFLKKRETKVNEGKREGKRKGNQIKRMENMRKQTSFKTTLKHFRTLQLSFSLRLFLSLFNTNTLTHTYTQTHTHTYTHTHTNSNTRTHRHTHILLILSISFSLFQFVFFSF